MRIIETTTELHDACRQLADGPFVTMDTEFMRESTYWPKLCLMQLAGPSGEVLIDPLSGDLKLGPFYELMADRSVTKVFHAARQDIEIVYTGGGLIPEPLFDTQVAAMVCGFGDSVGYENLVRKITGHKVDKGSRFTDWSRRPLSDRQLKYALSDVTHLRDVYETLRAQLAKSGRESWLEEEMAVLKSPDTYETAPENAWKRLKFKARSKRVLAVFMAAAAWRERKAQTRDIPRNRVLREETLGEIAVQQPKTPSELKRLRALPKNFADTEDAAQLLEVVAAAVSQDLSEIPEPQNGHEHQANGIGPIVEMLKVALKIASEHHHVASRLIATVGELEQIAVSDTASVPALRGWRRELFGEDALALKHGRKCLAIVDGSAVLLPSREAAEESDTPTKVSVG